MMNKKIMDKINNILSLVGLITAITMTVAYFVAVMVLIVGFEKKTLLQTTIFSVVSALIGLIIMASWRFQGQTWASMLDENKYIMSIYNNTKIKDRKFHNMTFFWTFQTLKDIFFRAGSIGATTIGVLYLVVVGSQDYRMLYLAIVHIIMWFGWGMLACAKAYNYYNNQFIPYIKNKIKENDPKVVFKEYQPEGFFEKQINKLKGDKEDDTDR